MTRAGIRREPETRFADATEFDELAEGWCLAKLPDLIGPQGVFCDGDWIETKDQNPAGDVRLIQLADIGEGIFKDKSRRFLTSAKARELNCTYLQPGDVLIARLPEPLGRACLFPGDPKKSVTAVDVCIVRPGSRGFDLRWMMYTINSPQIRNLIQAFEKGTTRPRISRSNLASIGLPVAPSAEQKRIAGVVEQLLMRINGARERLAGLPDILKRFRQAVLTAACSGRLTADWRESLRPPNESAAALLERIGSEKQRLELKSKNRRILPVIDDKECQWELPEDWRYVRLGAICSLIADIDHKMPKAVERGVKFLSAKDLWDDGTLNLSKDIKLISEDDYARLSRKAKPQRNDIIYSRIGARLGKARLVETDERFLVSYSCCVIRPLMVRPKYLVSFLNSSALLAKAQENAKSIGVPDLGLDEINRFVVPLPPLREQDEIVSRLGNLTRQASVIEKRVATAKASVDKITQVILAKAVRGELVPTEAELARREGRSYETASALLARVRFSTNGLQPNANSKR